MKNEISSAAYAASQTLVARGLVVKRSHLSEVIAALLGYRTYAALSTEEADTQLEYHLDDAEVIVLNEPLGATRCEELAVPIEAVADCIEAFKGSTLTPVFAGVSQFFDLHARELLENGIYDGEYVSGVMAESNASFSDNPDIDEGDQSGDLWQSTTHWEIEGYGKLVGSYDPDGDRMFNGDTLDVWGKLIYKKAGRAGLIFDELEEGASADDSWRDEDHDDEQNF
jgi:hypothetical protein